MTTEPPKSFASETPVAAQRCPGVLEQLGIFVSIGRVHIVVIASLGLSVFGWLFTGTFLWALSGLCALDWFLVNLLNRVVDLQEDRANRIRGTDWVGQHHRSVLIAGVLLLLISLVGVHSWAPWCTPWRLAFHGLGLLYNWRLRPKWPRIKELYFWKNAASATGFLITSFGYPLASVGFDPSSFAPGIDWRVVALVGIYFFLFELAYEVTYDLRDIRGDRMVGARTCPVVHGPVVAKRVILGLCSISALVLIGGFILNWIPWRVAVLAVGPILHGTLLIRTSSRGVDAPDCIRWTWVGCGLLLVYHGWIWMALPGIV